MSRTEINRACGAGKHRPEYFADRAPSPSQGEGWGEGEQSQARLRLPVSNRPLAVILSPRGEDNGAVGFGRGAKKPI
jgi:hypothetical protein